MKALNLAPIIIGAFLCFSMVVHYAISMEKPRYSEPPSISDYEPYSKEYEKASAIHKLEVAFKEIQSREVTVLAAIIAIVATLLCAPTYILNLILIRMKSSKVANFIHLPIIVVFIVWGVMMINNPGHISFNETGSAFIIFSLYLIFSGILGMIHANNYKKHRPLKIGNEEILDDLAN
ncbi:MAG: hypothetical protein JKY54_04815 [Flavobacteriales bacterium]|nr:hypothetical protein [Flavobacteriales bacterium]